MKRKAYGRDFGLSARMLLTTFLLGALYVAFFIVMVQIFDFGLVPMIVLLGALAFFQYFTSDKLALRASGAKVVSREEAPELHDMVERLCAMSDLPKPGWPSFRPTSPTRSRPAAAPSTRRWL